VLAGIFVATGARAETYAVIFTIGQYAEPSAKLKGIETDARLALDIAVRLGAVRPENRLVLADRQLRFLPMREALLSMKKRLTYADTLFVYFSGHGRRWARNTAASELKSSCQEGLVTVEGNAYSDALLRDDLEALASVAGRVIFFNDSCHSGGVVTKSFSAIAEGDLQVKAYPFEPKALPTLASDAINAAQVAAAAAAEAACTRISNAVTKSFRDSANTAAHKMLYLAASAEDEAAYATPEGSLATRAWHACMHGGADDLNRDGQISGRELAICAQDWMSKRFKREQQRITPQFNIDMPIFSASQR
jgi:hypothetical protein